MPLKTNRTCAMPQGNTYFYKFLGMNVALGHMTYITLMALLTCTDRMGNVRPNTISTF